MRDAYTRMCADRAHELARELPRLGRDHRAAGRLRPALIGYMAARIAEEQSGPAAYAAERAHQAVWLADRVG